jgi:hypothetical protein
MNSAPSKTYARPSKQFSSSILLWVRADQPRQTGMAYWKGPHSKVISATKGFKEYRQIHLADTNHGLWPTTRSVETQIPFERKIDGVAEVTFQSALSPLRGRKQTRLAFKDEVNVFRRTLLYLGPPRSSRWYEVAEPGQPVDARALIYIRRRDGIRGKAFRKHLVELSSALALTGVLKELRTQTFLPWIEKLWDTPDVAHDNPADQRFHASLILGFADPAARAAFFTSPEIETLSDALAPYASAVHAYEVSEALTFVRDGAALPHYVQ